MIIKEAKFLMSNTRVEDCPVPDKPEYAFIGRSNVGKSSLINMLTQQKGLAKTSSSPGKHTGQVFALLEVIVDHFAPALSRILTYFRVPVAW